jgi:prolyl 4-hydroxylase
MRQAPESTQEGDAAYSLAIHAASTAETRESWRAALAALAEAAGLRSRPACAELAALTGDWEAARQILVADEPPIAPGAALALDSVLAVPEKRIASISPRIATLEGFAAPELCDWLIARAAPKLGLAQVYDPDTGGARREQVRTNRECHLTGADGGFLLYVLRARIAASAELPVGAMEATAILHYTAGQEFLPHFDFLNTDKPAIAAEVARSGQRVLTFLLSLGDAYEGGETEFPVLGRRWKGRKGSALFFWNVEPNGAPDKRTLHAGLPPSSGEKWLLSQWIRSRVL